MRKEMPWTLEEKKVKSTKVSKSKKRSSKGKSLYSTIEELLKQNKDKEFSLHEIHEKVGKERVSVSAAIKTLYRNKKIKIVRFKENTANSAVPLYQYKNGKSEEIEIIEYNSPKCKKMQLVSIYEFLRNSKGLNDNLISVSDLKKKLRKANLKGTYVKTNTVYAHYYKKEDLERLTATKKSVKCKSSNKKTVLSSAKKEKVLKFKIFGFTITISR